MACPETAFVAIVIGAIIGMGFGVAAVAICHKCHHGGDDEAVKQQLEQAIQKTKGIDPDPTFPNKEN